MYSISAPVSMYRTLTVLVVVVVVLVATGIPQTEAKQKDGKLSTALDKYLSTIKCVANIAEETLPELNDFVACCGFWALNNFMLTKVEEECEEHNLKEVQELSGRMVTIVRDQCLGYEQGSFSCRMLVIMPIALGAFFFILLVSICICAPVSFYKWIQVRRKYRRVTNLTIVPRDMDPSEKLQKKFKANPA